MRALLLALCLCLQAVGITVTEDFTTATRFDTSSTAVWNLATNKGHLPFFVNTNGVGTNTPLNIGTGKDGSFDTTTYSKLDVNKGATPSVVTLDSSRIYEFTTFTLSSGFTLKASGTAPLQIRVQGAADVTGTIDLSGQPGSDMSADMSQSPPGGTATCAGGAGGNGASTATGTNGVGADSPGNGGGKAGTISGGKGGGGGGAGYDSAGTAGSGAGAGVAGANYGDTLLAALLGGSGGGGGGAGINSTGGGGGGGGGALFLAVGGNLHVISGGAIWSKGGIGGGTANAAFKGGGGGGGSGGAIELIAGGTFIDDGQVMATGGAGGTSTAGGAGGAGQKGRTRFVNIVDNSYSGSGMENPTPNMINFGKVVYDTSSSFILQSAILDTQNSAPTYNSLTFTGTVPGSTTAVLEMAGSSDGFVTNDTGYVGAAAVATLAGKRFYRFRVTLSSTDATKTPEVRTVVLDYTPRQQGTFSFGLAGCARTLPGAEGTDVGTLLWMGSWISLTIWGRRRRGRR